jgi:hypothetical protein
MVRSHEQRAATERPAATVAGIAAGAVFRSIRLLGERVLPRLAPRHGQDFTTRGGRHGQES